MADDNELRASRSSSKIAKAVAGAELRERKIGELKLGLIAKVRKPIPPPTRVAEDERKYSRARERERVRRGK